MPFVELTQIVHAAWIDAEPNKPDWRKYGMCMYCSNCKHRAGKYKHKTYRYCPWCGAKMDAEIRAEAYGEPYIFDAEEIKRIKITGTFVKEK